MDGKRGRAISSRVGQGITGRNFASDDVVVCPEPSPPFFGRANFVVLIRWCGSDVDGGEGPLRSLEVKGSPRKKGSMLGGVGARREGQGLEKGVGGDIQEGEWVSEHLFRECNDADRFLSLLCRKVGSRRSAGIRVQEWVSVAFEVTTTMDATSPFFAFSLSVRETRGTQGGPR